MEFETKNTDRSADISDIDRLTASTKKINLTPIHNDLSADDMPDEYIVNQHILEPPMANLETDSDTTTAYLTPETTVNHTGTSRSAVILIGLTAAITCAAIAYWLLLRR